MASPLTLKITTESQLWIGFAVPAIRATLAGRLGQRRDAGGEPAAADGPRGIGAKDDRGPFAGRPLGVLHPQHQRLDRDGARGCGQPEAPQTRLPGEQAGQSPAPLHRGSVGSFAEICRIALTPRGRAPTAQL